MSFPTGSTTLDRRARIDRMRSRSWVLQILYLREAQAPKGSLVEAMETVLRTRRISHRRIPFVTRSIESLEAHLPEVDEALGAAMENWRLDRLSTVDRSILRLAAAEILLPGDVPPRVAIQEGIRLAGQYGGDDSPRFVNGVLDAVYRAHVGEGSHP